MRLIGSLTFCDGRVREDLALNFAAIADRTKGRRYGAIESSHEREMEPVAITGAAIGD
jgi:hypothetical protein